MHRAKVLTYAHVCVAFLLALLSVVGSPTPAQAHATLVSTAPADRQALGAAPRQVSLTFSEPVSLPLARIRLIGPDGDTVATGRPARSGGRSETVTVSVPDASADGTYTVAWHAVSADSHPVQGAFAFTVGRSASAAAPAPGTAPRPDSWTVALYDITRWVSFVGLALLLGTACFIAACRPGSTRRSSVRRLLWSGWSALLAATAIGFLLYGPYAGGTSLSSATDPRLMTATLDTRMGRMLLLRAALLGAAAMALVMYLRRAAAHDLGRRPGSGPEREALTASAPGEGGRKRRTALVLTAGCGLALTWSLAAHSAVGPLVAFALVADTVHLVAMAVWIGGLVVLATVLRRPPDVSVLEPVVRRFSRTARICVVLLLVTGVFQAWRQVGTAPALLGSAYGRVLLAKMCLVVVLVALGAAARGWVRRHCGSDPAAVAGRRPVARQQPGGSQVRRFRRLVVAETVIAAVLLGLSAVLVNTDPPRDREDQAAPAARTPAAQQHSAETAPTAPAEAPFSKGFRFDAGGKQGRGVLLVVVGPAATGLNEVHLSVLDQQGRPSEVPEVRAEFTLREASIGPIRAPLTYLGPGHYTSTGFSLPVRGRWELSVTVRTSEVDQAIVRTAIDVR
ncbi:copper transport protein [Streptomyces sp. V4I23]|uniref:copper resistance CopC/CopD family protein n=1 Tax=Streptomyces sp. V4I23 TaxID=3042282 RepID=UPI00278B5ADE|nr:copper resistance protein CopC [Streptomyces sp. V4I23]MDQ1009075.1 copper transport protein [Streptomyces sp. V4I23]